MFLYPNFLYIGILSRFASAFKPRSTEPSPKEDVSSKLSGDIAAADLPPFRIGKMNYLEFCIIQINAININVIYGNTVVRIKLGVRLFRLYIDVFLTTFKYLYDVKLNICYILYNYKLEIN